MNGKSTSNASSSKEAEAAAEKQPIADRSTSSSEEDEAEEKDILTMFAEETTFPGLPRVILARSRLSRYFWLLICLACFISFGVGIFELLQRYFRYEKKVTVEMVSDPVAFPHVTLCNMRSLDFEVLHKINEIFLKDPQVLSFLDKPTGDKFVDAYIKFLATFSRMYFEKDTKNDTSKVKALNEALSRLSLYAEIPKSDIEDAGIQLEQYVVRCSMGNVPCNLTSDFHRFLNQFYFNCYTFDHVASRPINDDDGDGEKELPWLAPGLDNGVSMIVLTGSGMLKPDKTEAKVIPGLYDFRSPIAGADGVRVVIHSPNVVPFPLAEGFDVPPGFSVSFGVRPRRNVRIGPPHGDCVSEDPFGKKNEADSKTNVKVRPYRQLVCQKECIQQLVKKECNCYDETLLVGDETLLGDLSNLNTYSNSTPMCHSTDHFPKTCVKEASPECFKALLVQYNRIHCAEKIRDEVRAMPKMMASCGCRAACDELLYDVSYSLSRWPAAGNEGDCVYNELFNDPAGPVILEKFHEKWPSKWTILKEHFNESNINRLDALRDFARINVFVADPEVIVTRESKDYELSQLVSDIGGQLGVWIGLSVITAAEVVELVIQIIERKRKRQRKQAANKASVNS